MGLRERQRAVFRKEDRFMHTFKHLPALRAGPVV